jgi:hypothetical protein
VDSVSGRPLGRYVNGNGWRIVSHPHRGFVRTMATGRFSAASPAAVCSDGSIACPAADHPGAVSS